MQVPRHPRRQTSIPLPLIADTAQLVRVVKLAAILDQIVPPERMPGLLVAIARTQAGYSQDDLAALSGLHRGTIARTETSRTPIKRGRAELLGAILALPPDLLESP